MQRDFLTTRYCGLLAGIMLAIAAGSFPLRANTQVARCDPTELANHHASLDVFRRLQIEIATLMQAQSEAILEVGNGVVISSLDDGGFFGPTGFLGKRMDKGQSAIISILISGRRLQMDKDTSARLSEIEASAEEIIAIGHSMVKLLESGQTKEATRLYAEQSVPAQVAAVGAAYTMSSVLERKAKRVTLSCR